MKVIVILLFNWRPFNPFIYLKDVFILSLIGHHKHDKPDKTYMLPMLLALRPVPPFPLNSKGDVPFPALRCCSVIKVLPRVEHHTSLNDAYSVMRYGEKHLINF